MKVLILYSGQNGQTRSIASYIANTISTGADVHNLLLADQVDLTQYQKVLIGASVRYGRFHSALYHFVARHADQLNQMPSALFTVNLTARKPEKCSPQTNPYTRKFLLKSPWQPKTCAVFAGALRYPHYRWYDRMMIQLIMRMTGGETDTRKEVEYTNWDHVKRYAQEFDEMD